MTVAGSICTGVLLVVVPSGPTIPGSSSAGVSEYRVVAPPQPNEIAMDDATRTFCDQHQLRDAVRISLAIASRHFQSTNARIFLSDDPDDDSKWLSIRVDTPLNLDRAFAAFDAYTDDWVRAAPRGVIAQVVLDYDCVNAD
jgi:hypothetical protein